ncbi:MAG: energy-coupling factor ABC transporter ATP-binding protein [Oscillospiraceae bacterium]|nr:energy-coupling factor ABC transporter ATP-binding protein [Oscillospiraceae bacterium]
MILVENLEYQYSPRDPLTLKGINITIDKGEMVALIGQNGSGKTTLLRQLNGLSKPTKGRVVVAGMDTSKTRVSEMAKHIGYLFQNPDHQIFCQTVEEEIEFGMKNLGLPEDEIKDRAYKTAQLLGIEGKMQAHPFSLSRGERQRTALAGVLAIKPEVLVLDEPTTGQDYRECVKIMDIVTELNGQGVTVLMVSHDMEVVVDYTKRAIMLYDGQVIGDGNTVDVLWQKEELERTGLKPPQMIDVAITLGGYEGVYSVETLFEAIKDNVKNNGKI